MELKKITLRNLGKIFKSKLDQRPFDFSEKYWNDLEKRLDAHSGKGGTNQLGWISFSAIATAIIVSAVWFFYPKNANEIAKSENVSSEKTGIKNISENSVNENKLSVQKIKNGISSDKIMAENSEIKSEKNTELINENQKIKTENKKEFSSEKENTILNSSVKKEEKNIPDIQKKKNTSSESKEDSFVETTPKGFETLSGLISELVGYNFSEEPENKNSYSENSNLNFLLMNKINFYEFPKNENEELKTIITKESSRRRINSYYIGAYSGIMYTDKILKSTDEKLSEYISRRKNEESSALTQNFGIDFGIGQNCWSISTGINYHEQGEIINYKPEIYQWLKNSTSSWSVNDNSFWKTDTVNTFSVVVAQGGWQPTNIFTGTDTITVNQYVTDTTYIQNFYVTTPTFVPKFDSVPVVSTDSTYKLVGDVSSKPEKTISKISYYEIPVLIGYEFPINRIALMLRTGFSIGMLSKVSANYLKNDISGTEEISMERMNKTVLNYILRTGVLFYCTENVILNFEPMFRTNINSVFKNENFTQKYWNAGMNVGLIYRF